MPRNPKKLIVSLLSFQTRRKQKVFAFALFFLLTSILPQRVSWSNVDSTSGVIESIRPLSDDQYVLVLNQSDKSPSFLIDRMTLVQVLIEARDMQRDDFIFIQGEKLQVKKKAKEKEEEKEKKSDHPKPPKIPEIPKPPKMPKPPERPEVPEPPKRPDAQTPPAPPKVPEPPAKPKMPELPQKPPSPMPEKKQQTPKPPAQPPARSDQEQPPAPPMPAPQPTEEDQEQQEQAPPPPPKKEKKEIEKFEPEDPFLMKQEVLTEATEEERPHDKFHKVVEVQQDGAKVMFARAIEDEVHNSVLDAQDVIYLLLSVDDLDSGMVVNIEFERDGYQNKIKTLTIV